MIAAILMGIFKPFYASVGGIVMLILFLIVSMGLSAIFVTKTGLEKIKGVTISWVVL